MYNDQGDLIVEQLKHASKNYPVFDKRATKR